ncbi:MAG TPA: hypothetical protein VLZ12_15425, partial [Verrucomicrobiae bacterium]|nr:hypothetical protein [Verrucomicrobiae bacterium]
MSASTRVARLLSVVFVGSRMLVEATYAQSATITVASIPNVLAGNSISVNYTLTNTGTSSRTFGVDADIRQGATVLTDLGAKGTSSVAPGATATGSYIYIVPAGWSNGTYTAHATVWTGTPGSTTLLDSYDRDFSVQSQATAGTITVASIPAVLAGNSISVNYTITNNGNYSRTFGV